MQTLNELAREMARRVRGEVRCEAGEIILEQGGREIRVCEDKEHERLVIWTDLTDDIFAQNRIAAARASIIVNESESFNRAVSIGTLLGEDALVAGRSFDAADIDAVELLAQLDDFSVQMNALEQILRKECAKEAGERPAADPLREDGGSHILRI